MGNFITVHDIGFQNRTFWLYMLMKYPNTSINECIQDIGQADSNEDWIDKLTQYYDGVFDGNDGYVENPHILIVPVNKDVNLKIEFHPGDTIYYFNDAQIGSIGSHWMIYCFTWDELIKIVSNSDNGTYLFHLLLPLTALTACQQIMARDEILKRLSQMGQLVLEKDHSVLAECIIKGITVSSGFENNPSVGTICNHINSKRFLRNNNHEKVRRINKYIVSAQMSKDISTE